MSEKIGFIGSGQMGQPMAHNLLKAGFQVAVHNRTPAKAETLIAQGARWAPTPADAIEPGGIVFTMLANDEALEEVARSDSKFLEKLGAGGVHVSMSTVSPQISRALAHDHARHGAAFLAAPVFGRPEAAAAGKLWICVSGPAAARARVAPLLKAISQGVFDYGEDPGAACVAKLAGNFLIQASIEALGEALALAWKNGVDRAKVCDMLTRTIFACTVYQGYGSAMVHERFKPAGFRLSLALKDAGLIQQAAEASRTPMPFAAIARDRLLSAMAKDREEWDMVAMALGAFEDAGIP